jgi:uncharacterized protein YjbI with pentapeptide repeats
MNRSNFTEADLTGADMSKAELARVVFAKATIAGVSFKYSNLSRADLRGVDAADANLTGSYLFLTKLDGANLSGTSGLVQAQIDVACGTSETQLPAGLAPPRTWPCPKYDDED